MEYNSVDFSINMFRLLVVAVALFVAIQAKAIPKQSKQNSHRSIFPAGKIVGGQVTTIEDRPWQVSLEDTGFMFCGGSIISENFVLTAAHCTDGNLAEDITIRYGSDQLVEGGHLVTVSKIHQNPNFDYILLDNDVSVLALASAIPLTNSSKPIPLRTAEAQAKEIAVVSGWGTLHEGDLLLPDELHKVSVPVVNRDVCNLAYIGEITENMICAGEAGKDSCQGDSGGALTIDDQQVGIVSFGYGCAEDGYPGVYSNVASLKKFIDQNSNNEATWV